jgi:hypothetical protein
MSAGGNITRINLRGTEQTELAWVAQLVERVLGKDEVTGSIPVPGSRITIAVRIAELRKVFEERSGAERELLGIERVKEEFRNGAGVTQR